MEANVRPAEADNEADREIEALAVKELESHIESMRRLQPALRRIFKPDEVLDAQGKRCILVVQGLRHHTPIFFFEVTGGSLQMVSPYDNYDTKIYASVSSILRVFRKLLAGVEGGFAEEWARGYGKIEGKRSVHDAYMFASIFDTLARRIRETRQKMGI